MTNPEFQRIKHTAVDYHFIHEQYEDGTITIPNILSQLQNAHVFTKVMSHNFHNFLVCKLMLLNDLNQFERECEESIHFGTPAEHDTSIRLQR